MPDLEIISVDPNCFYSSNDEDGEIDFKENPFIQSIATDQIQMQLNESIDIITLNIDDHDLFTDSHEEDILFSSDKDDLQQFDLASYIVGESTSLLLSPPPAILNQRKSPLKTSSARKRLTSFSEPIKMINESNAQANHKIVEKTPANNRRKRKNLTREFIDTSSDDDDNHQSDKKTKLSVDTLNSEVDSTIKKRNNNNDPIWSPSIADSKLKRCKKLPTKQSTASHSTEKCDIKMSNKHPTTSHGNGNGLRNLIKHQLQQNRPMKPSKLLKSNATINSDPDKTEARKTQLKRIGLGRGKDITITAKYYNCSESSDNYERDTDQINKNSRETSSESSESDVEEKDEDDNVPQMKALVKESHDIKPKMAQNSTKSKQTIPILIDSNNSMDSSDFAKALEHNAKATVTKTKPLPRKVDIEQQKRLIKSALLLQNPAKFKMISGSNISSGTESKPFRDLKANNLNSNSNSTPLNVIKQKLPQTVDIKSDNLEKKIDLNETPTKVIETEAIDENKVETNSKKKLNIQEYLKRKNLKRKDDNCPNENQLKLIKTESSNDGTIKNENGNKHENDDKQQNQSNCESMYEEIIIVSMGCNTDISIPGSSFIHKSEKIQDIQLVNSTVLLSNIQTTVEKVNSTAETAIISSCSLISSIQDVILKKTQNNETDVKKVKSECENGKKGADNDDDDVPEHGENKTIMHLRKDRIRPTTVTIGIQTEPYFQFPPLEKFTPKKQASPFVKRNGSLPPNDSTAKEIVFNRNQLRHRKNYRAQNHLSESSYYSDEENSSQCERRSRHSDFYNNGDKERMAGKRNQSRRRSGRYDRYLERNRTISRSLSESSDTSTSSSDSSSTSSSSSSSNSSRSSCSRSTISTASSSRTMNSYGGSSSKSYYGDDHQYYRIRTKSNNSNRSRQQTHRSNSPGLFFS